MKKYTIRIQQYPVNQHPPKYLNVVCEQEGEYKDINWVMDQYQRNRHAMEWEVIDKQPTNETPICEVIKYKFDNGEPIV